jgi:hypothetical protein
MSQTRTSAFLGALALAVPATLGALWLSWWFVTDPPRGPVPGASLGDAVREDDIRRTFSLIRAGADPNAPILFNDEWTGGDDVRVTPLLIAVAYDRVDTVRTLLNNGAVLDAPGNRYAVCLATRLKREELVPLLVRLGGADPSHVVCPRAEPPMNGPLKAYVD